MNELLKSILRAVAVFGGAFLLLVAFFWVQSWLQDDAQSITIYLQKWDLFLVGLILYCVYLVIEYVLKKNRNENKNRDGGS